jgi:hypothetical protein
VQEYKAALSGEVKQKVLSTLKGHYDAAKQAREKVIEPRRANLLRYYNQEMTHLAAGENDSKVVTSEVRDVVETLVPQLIEPFFSSDELVVFEPRGEEDMDAAKLETDYTNYVVRQKNQGFLIFTQWLKDGLLQVNGYTKAYWKEDQAQSVESHTGLDLEGFLAVTSDNEDGKVLQADIRTYDAAGNEYDQTTIVQQVMAGQVNPAVLMFDVKCVRENVDGGVEVCNVAPENFYIDPNHGKVSPQGSGYCCEKMHRTRDTLKEMGFEPGVVDAMPLYNFNADKVEKFTRDKGEKSVTTPQGHKGSQVVEVLEHYVRADLFDAGKANLWQVFTDSKCGEVLSIDVVDRIPYHAWTPIIMPHLHYGKAAAELVKDLQDIHTVLMRRTLDNTLQVLKPRPQVDLNQIDPENTYNDLMDTSPGAVLRVRGQNAIVWQQPPSLIATAMPMFEKMAQMYEGRTGLSRMAQGLDSTALADATNVVGPMVMSQSLLRVKMMLRTFAETGVASLMQHVRELVAKHESKQRMFELAGKFVPVNPREWRKQRNTVVKVGIGYSDKLQRLAAIQNATALMKDVVAMQGGVDGPLVSLDNAHNIIADNLKESGLTGVGRYVTAPENAPPPPPPDDTPSMEDLAEAELVANASKDAARLAFDRQKHRDDTNLRVADILLKYQKQNTDKAMDALDRATNESITNGT